MPTLDLSFLNDTSRSHFIPTVKQSIYQKTPLFNVLDSKGKVQPATGTSLIWDTIAEKSANVVWYSGYDVFANQPNRPTRQASLSPANLSVPMAISGEEERKNSGSMEKLVDMVKTQFDNAKATMRDALSTSIYSSGATIGGRAQVTGLAAAIDNDNTYAGIDRTGAGNTYWQANINSTAHTLANEKDPTSTSYLPSLMRTKITDCTLETVPDLIVTTAGIWNLYQDIMEGKIRLTNDTADGGFQRVQFSPGLQLIYDKYCTTSAMYFLNTEDWYLYVYSEANFSLKDGGWVNAQNQDAKIAFLLWSGQLVCERPIQQGAITSIAIS